MKWFNVWNPYNASISYNVPLGSNYKNLVSWSSDNSSWYTLSLLIGPNIYFSLSKIMKIEFRILVGYAMSASPNANFDGFIFKSELSNTFGYNIGTGISTSINSSLACIFNIDYTGANFKYSNSYPTGIVYQELSPITTVKSINLINATIGIGYNF